MWPPSMVQCENLATLQKGPRNVKVQTTIVYNYIILTAIIEG